MKLLSASVALLLATLLSAPMAEPAASGATFVLLSIDGLKPDYIRDADKHGFKVPNLRRLLNEGAHASGVRGVLPTVTYPSHATMVTGVAPARHGIYYNTSFDPMNKNQTGWQWYAEDIRVETLWHAAAKTNMV